MFNFQSPDNPIAHDDAGFLRPEAWDEAKIAFGRGSDISQMLARLERCKLASSRLLLAAAISAFLSASPEEQACAIRRYLMRVNRHRSSRVETGTRRAQGGSFEGEATSSFDVCSCRHDTPCLKSPP